MLLSMKYSFISLGPFTKKKMLKKDLWNLKMNNSTQKKRKSVLRGKIHKCERVAIGGLYESYEYEAIDLSLSARFSILISISWCAVTISYIYSYFHVWIFVARFLWYYMLTQLWEHNNKNMKDLLAGACGIDARKKYTWIIENDSRQTSTEFQKIIN